VGREVHHVRQSLLDVADTPHRILARRDRLVIGSQFGDSTFFLPSVRPDRVWVVDVDPLVSVVRAVREVTADGVTVAPATIPPRRRWPLGAVDDGLLLATTHGLDVWDPRSGKLVRHLYVDPGTLGPTSGRTVVTCSDADCRSLRFTDSRTGAMRDVPAPAGTRFEPWAAAFAPNGRLLAVPIHTTRQSPRRLAMVDVPGRRVAVVPGSTVPRGYTLVTWSESGRDVFLTGGGALSTRRVLLGYRLGAPRAQSIDVHVGPFYDVAAI
jgi:hypothetical protein